MRICIVSDFYHPYPGGISEHVHHTACELKKLGHTVKILTTNYPAKVFPDFSEDYYYPITPQDIIRVGIALPRAVNKSMGVTVVGIGLRKRIREVLKNKFNVVHMHGPHPFLPFLALRYSRGVNILTFHASAPPSRGYKYFAHFTKKYVKKLDSVIAVSREALRTMQNFMNIRYTIIPNGIDTERFSPTVSPIPKYKDGGPNILFVGRFEPRKGLKYLLEAFPIVRKKIPTARLIVVGKGWFGRIKDLTARGIYFEGHISPYDIPKYYASCDLFCSPATGRESFGIILLEAMSSGKPVVASNIPGYKEVIKDGEDGLLVEPENPSLLAQAIIKVLTNKELSQKLSASGRKKALKYSWSIVTKRIEEFYLKRLRNKDLTSSKYIIQKNDER